MLDFYRFAQPDSPFLLYYSKNADSILEGAVEHIELCSNPQPPVSLAHCLIVAANTHRVILILEPEHLAKFNLDSGAIDFLAQGVQLPLQSIQAGYILSQYPPGERQEVLEGMIPPTPIGYTKNLITVAAQSFLDENVQSLANLYRIDPTGALIFAHVQKYCKITNEVFQNGMEIAAIVYWNLAPRLATLLGDDKWLNPPDTFPHDPMTDFGQPFD